jgi:hypothetical protein
LVIGSGHALPPAPRQVPRGRSRYAAARSEAACHGIPDAIVEDARNVAEARYGIKDYIPETLFGGMVRPAPLGAVFEPADQQDKPGDKSGRKNQPKESEDFVLAHSRRFLRNVHTLLRSFDKFLVSHSHTTRTCHPSFLSARKFRLSRSTFRASLLFQ